MAFFKSNDDKNEDSTFEALKEKIYEKIDSTLNDNKDVCEYIKSNLGLQINNNEIFIYCNGKDRDVQKIKDFVYRNVFKENTSIGNIKFDLHGEDDNSLRFSLGYNAPKTGGVENWKLASIGKDNLSLMLSACKSEIINMVETANAPAPYYFERVAILAKKEKRYTLEVLACETYIALCKIYKKAFKACGKKPFLNISGSARYLKIKERLPKAKENLRKIKVLNKTKNK